MLPDIKSFWISVVVMTALGISMFKLGLAWLGVIVLAFVALGVIAFFVRKSKEQIPDKRFAETPAPAFAAPVVQVEMPARKPLSEEGRMEAERLLRALHAAGIIAPDLPAVDEFADSIADYGEPVEMLGVLSALHEAEDTARYWRNLAFHDEQVEQFAEYFQDDMADLCRLAQYTDWAMQQAHCEAPQNGEMRCVVQARIGTQYIDMDEIFFSKYRNVNFYVRIAQALRTVDAPRRLAWLYSDSGIWLTGLPPQTDLNTLPQSDDGWQWIDELTPQHPS